VSGNPDIQRTWPLLLKTEKVGEILFVFFLNYWVNWIKALLNSGLPDTILEGDHPPTISPKFGLKWPSGFRGEYFSNCVRTDDRRKLMTKSHMTLWVR
jgi:hypothetical protein